MRIRFRCLSFLNETDRARQPDPSCDRALVQVHPRAAEVTPAGRLEIWRIEKAARQYPAASWAQNRLVSKSPVRPGCGRFALAGDRGESKLLFRSKEQTSRCD
jgi:hypothetical protein